MDRILRFGMALAALMAGTQLSFSQLDPAAAVLNDYNGDGISELAVYNESLGIWNAEDPVSSSQIVNNVQWGFNGSRAVPGDYNGDTNADLAVYGRTTGRWFVRSVSGAVQFWDKDWGFNGAVPVYGDYDSDGSSDFAVFYPPTGMWFIQSSLGAVLVWFKQWGFSAAIPVPGDYDGDGGADLAVYDRNTGRWYITNPESNNTILWNYQWGYSGAVPVPGDFDGDGTNDLAVYDSQNAKWYIKNSGGTVVWGKTYGTPNTGVIPMAADYDGDQDDDLAAYASTTGVWNCTDDAETNNLAGLTDRLEGNASSKPVGAPEVAMHLPILTGGEGFLFKANTTLVLLPSRYNDKVARVVFANDPAGQDVFFNLYFTGYFGGRMKWRWTELKGLLGGRRFYTVVFPIGGGLPQPYLIYDGGSRQE